MNTQAILSAIKTGGASGASGLKHAIGAIRISSVKDAVGAIGRYRTAPRTPIGIDVGSRYVKAVQLDKATTAAGRLRVAAAAIFPRSEPGTAIARPEVRRLGDVLYRHGFTGSAVVLAVPADRLLTTVI